VLQQIVANIFGQWYTQIAPSFSIPNFTSAPHNPGGNDRAYAHASSNYQAPYTTVAYTNLITLLSSLLGFLPNHAYQNPPRFNAYGQPEVSGFGYETPSQFFFRLQSINMTLARATAEPSTDPNNLTNQLATILRNFFDIEPKGRGHVYQKSYLDYYD
jgi:hypothetical protein